MSYDDINYTLFSGVMMLFYELFVERNEVLR